VRRKDVIGVVNYDHASNGLSEVYLWLYFLHYMIQLSVGKHLFNLLLLFLARRHNIFHLEKVLRKQFGC
jgi:hypothetical protein